ncbi:MAG: hypothetical protein ACR2P1_09225 [Pseudomonadales bacterium]
MNVVFMPWLKQAACQVLLFIKKICNILFLKRIFIFLERTGNAADWIVCILVVFPEHKKWAEWIESNNTNREIAGKVGLVG